MSPFLSQLLAGSGGTSEWLVDLAAHWQWLFLAILVPSALVTMLSDRCWAWLILAAPLPWLSAAAAAPAAPRAMLPDEVSLSVASANVLYRNQDASELVRWLARDKPDIVVLLEVTPAYAQDLRLLDGYPYRHVIAEPGAFGIAVLSRHPVAQAQALRDEEGIATVQAKIRWQGQWIRLAALHPKKPQSARYHASRNGKLESLTVGAAADELPMIVAGDLNATPWSNAFAGLAERGWHRASGLAPTWPSALGGWLGIPIDHVLVNRHWSVLSAAVGPDLGSDHLPVLVRLVPRPSVAPGSR